MIKTRFTRKRKTTHNSNSIKELIIKQTVILYALTYHFLNKKLLIAAPSSTTLTLILQ